MTPCQLTLNMEPSDFPSRLYTGGFQRAGHIVFFIILLFYFFLTDSSFSDKIILMCGSFTPLTEIVISAKVQELIKKLTVIKNTTSSYIRKHVSAHDKRLSAMTIGHALGTAILASVFICIFILDLPIVFRHIRYVLLGPINVDQHSS